MNPKTNSTKKLQTTNTRKTEKETHSKTERFLNYSIKVPDVILYSTCIVLFAYLSYVNYCLIERINELSVAVSSLSNTVEHFSRVQHDLTLDLKTLKTGLQQRDLRISELESSLRTYEMMNYPLQQQAPEMLQARNDMIKFTVKAVAGLVLGTGVAYVLYSFIGIPFSFKTLLPGFIYKYIHRNTPFFQEYANFYAHDKLNDIQWWVQIRNNTDTFIYGKFVNSGDYLEASAFIKSIIENPPNLALVPYVSGPEVVNTVVSAATSNYQLASYLATPGLVL